MNYQFVQKIFDAPLDIIGDIHGEIEALKTLIRNLGYDENGYHPQKRKLIFVGDLCDRGEDSIAVILLVKDLIEKGNAQCVLGNHELNLLIHSQREGNGWFFGSPHEDDHKPFNSKIADLEQKQIIWNFLNTLPIALESDSIRVVHASWDNDCIERLKTCNFNSVAEANQHYQNEIEHYIEQLGIAEHAEQEQQTYRLQLKNIRSTIPLLKNLGKKDVIEQMFNPIRVLTSGVEGLTQQPFFAGGKWRMVERLTWWDHYQDDTPVLIGHYWRSLKPTKLKTGLFKYIDALSWFGAKSNVFCVDYSVGKRYLDRAEQAPFSTHLAALRFPEKVLVLENGEQLTTL